MTPDSIRKAVAKGTLDAEPISNEGVAQASGGVAFVVMMVAAFVFDASLEASVIAALWGGGIAFVVFLVVAHAAKKNL